jgi:hypothetical protein
VVKAIKSKSRWEFRQTIMRIHFNAVIFTTSLIGGLKGPFVSGAVKSEELVKSITDALECTTGSVPHTVCPTG